MDIQERLNKLWPLLRLYETEPYNIFTLSRILRLCKDEQVPFLPFKPEDEEDSAVPLSSEFHCKVAWEQIGQEGSEWVTRFLSTLLPWCTSGCSNGLGDPLSPSRWGDFSGRLIVYVEPPERESDTTWEVDQNDGGGGGLTRMTAPKFLSSHYSIRRLSGSLHYYIKDMEDLNNRCLQIVNEYNDFASLFLERYGDAHLEKVSYKNLTPFHKKWTEDFLVDCAPSLWRKICGLHSRAFYGSVISENACPFIQSWEWLHPGEGIRDFLT